MSFKKPRHLIEVPDRPSCPICGKPSYSASGEHPQCSFARADAALKKARLAELASEAPSEPDVAPPRVCPRCQRVRKRITCVCGYRFAPADRAASSDRSVTVRTERVPDRTIIQDVANKLSRGGVRSPCHVTIASRNGEVTLSGTVQFMHQQQSALRIATGVNGVRRVVSQLTVKAPVKR